MQKPKFIESELAVIGCGMAGMAAAIFATARGVPVVQIGNSSEILFASGYMDLMGVYPVADRQIWENPWAAISILRREIPRHPYARIPEPDIRSSMNEFFSFIEKIGIPYRREMERNCRMLTPMGTLKPTYAVPETMWHSVAAMQNKSSCLLIDIRGLRGFSARQLAEVLKNRCPDIASIRISFPDTEHLKEVYAEHLARLLCNERTQDDLASAIRPYADRFEYVGIPAVLGVFDAPDIWRALQERIGATVFEIPTMPPSVPGLRLKESFEQALPAMGVRQVLQKQVLRAKQTSDGAFVLDIGQKETEWILKAKAIILATGRFLGKGLQANRHGVRESLFDLPVTQPASRDQWHRKDFFDPRGHSINRCGLEIDNRFRPLNRNGNPAFQTLFAAGSILAHQDWMRMKCGSGLAVATAFAAVNAYVNLR